MKKKLYYFILLPAVVLLLFFLFLPLVESIFPTFFQENRVSFSAYLTFFKDSYNQTVVLRTLKIALIVTLFCALLGLPTSFYISQTKKKYRGLLLSLTLFPLLTNSVIRSFAWINILGKEGVINQLLLKSQLISQPFSFLYTEFAIIIGSIYLFLPTMIITLVGVLETIDLEILEASQSLGATPFKTFYKILLPLAIPGVIVGSTLVFHLFSDKKGIPRVVSAFSLLFPESSSEAHLFLLGR